MKPPGIIMIIGLLFGCSQGALTPEGDDGFEKGLISFVGFTGSVLNPQKRFVGYGTKMRRVSLIDPQSRSEIWGSEVTGKFTFFEPLPDLSGVILVAKDEMRVISPAGSESFNLYFINDPFVVASDHKVAVAMIDPEGGDTEVVRFKDGNWQRQIINTVDEAPSFSEKFTVPVEGVAPATVLAWLGEGSELLFFSPYTGAYQVWWDNEAGDLEMDPKRSCSGLVGNPTDAAWFRSMETTSDGTGMYLADFRGGLHFVDLQKGECQPVEELSGFQLDEPWPVTRLTLADDAQILATQAGGYVYSFVFRRVAGKFDANLSMNGVCGYPLGVLPVSQGVYGVACYEPENFDSVADKAEAPSLVTYNKASFVAVDLENNNVLSVTSIDPQDTAGVALDPETLALVRLRDSAVGVLETVDLTTGERTSKKGIFLDDILD